MDNIILNEQEEQEFLRFKESFELFKEAILKYKSEHMFFTRVKGDDHEIHISMYLEPREYTIANWRTDELAEIKISFDVIFPKDVHPYIPTDVLSRPTQFFISELKRINPILGDQSKFPQMFLDKISYKITHVSIFPGNGILSLGDYISRNIYNTTVIGPRSFGQLFYSDQLVLQTYTIPQEELPKFSSEFTDTMNKLVKKTLTIFKALQKGTWRGHTYELDKPTYNSSISVHLSKFQFNLVDKVIHPDFSVKLNLGWETVDGRKNKPEEGPLTETERAEFKKYLQKKFEHFGIGYY